MLFSRSIIKLKRQTVSDRWEWAGSHPQAGAVCVGSDHGEAVSCLVASADGESDDAGEVPGQKVLKTGKIVDYSRKVCKIIALI